MGRVLTVPGHSGPCSARAKGRDPVGSATLALHVFASPRQLWSTPVILVGLLIVALVVIRVSLFGQ